MVYKLKNMKMIAFGGQAEIFEIDDKSVLRVMKNPGDEALLKNEFEITKTLKASGVSVPDVYDYVDADGRPALVVERIDGVSMMDIMKKSPIKALSQVKLLARMHCGVLAADAAGELYEASQRAKYLVDKSPLLSVEVKKFVMSLTEKLPEGGKLCHGDFHPGNILLSHGKYYIIDWFGATKGSAISDIAHSYLIFKNTPDVPGLSRAQNAVVRRSGGLMAAKYLKVMDKAMHIPWDEFSRWLVVKAAERTFYGMPSEKKRLVEFIEQCESSKGKEQEWYKYL